MAMNHSTKTGFSFGVTSAIITTLGLMVGLYAGTHSTLVVIGAILTIAMADAFSDALGIHISEESENKHTGKEIWTSTLTTFFFKFIFTMTFMVPVLLFELGAAISVGIIWGLSLLGVLSAMMARERKEKPWIVIGEHLAIAVAVIIITNYVGIWIAGVFG
jgi:VIT1/CCC1 family predicted Fe2+/Mn2+ transporter